MANRISKFGESITAWGEDREAKKSMTDEQKEASEKRQSGIEELRKEAESSGISSEELDIMLKTFKVINVNEDLVKELVFPGNLSTDSYEERQKPSKITNVFQFEFRGHTLRLFEVSGWQEKGPLGSVREGAVLIDGKTFDSGDMSYPINLYEKFHKIAWKIFHEIKDEERLIDESKLRHSPSKSEDENKSLDEIAKELLR